MRKILLPFVLLLTACFGASFNLETNNRKLQAAEVTFQELTKTAVIVHPRLSTSARSKVKNIIEEAHSALVLTRMALDLADQVDFDSKLATVNSLLTLLRPILESMEEANNGFKLNFAT